VVVYALAIFTGAFLLFQVQPLIGKYILPWFGGGPGVWTTCMLFFQVALLAGYAYAHFSSRRLRPRVQVIVHLALLAAALALLPITPSPNWKPDGSTQPVIRILLLLAACLGLPYLVLASTGPLMQDWFSRTEPGRSPYRLYALSNAASLIALLSYPVVFETHFTRRTQAAIWAWGLAVYAVFVVWCALKIWRAGCHRSPEAAGSGSAAPAYTEPQLAHLHQLLWLLLPACGSVLLLATTNKLCQDVAVVPFLWVVPLAVYLLSFVICFDSPRWYVRPLFTLALVAALAAFCWALAVGSTWPLWKQASVYCGALFVCCMVCHGELYRLRPGPAHLTRFYLCLSAGGALGGVIVALGGPALLTDYYELHWGAFACALLFLLVCISERGAADRNWRWPGCLLPLAALGGTDFWLVRMGSAHTGMPKEFIIALRIGMWLFVVMMAGYLLFQKKLQAFRHWRLLSCALLGLGTAALGMALWMQTQNTGTDTVHRSRNFYGVLKVNEYNKAEPEWHYFLLQHGRITHGIQFTDPAQALQPSTYYGEGSGIALAFGALPAGSRRLGVVGLGTGSLAIYARRQDSLRVYEINPEVERVARSRFSYLTKCAGKLEIAMGDARLSLEQEPSQQFDLLALDAFSSDSIPVHLLTREAFAIYGRHVKTNGVIAVHISNHFLELQPVIANVAREFHYRAVVIDYDETDEEWWLYSSTWVLLSHNNDLIDSPAICAASSGFSKNLPQIPLWTDDFASVFQILKMKAE
jgi:hypothetical protein